VTGGVKQTRLTGKKTIAIKGQGYKDYKAMKLSGNSGVAFFRWSPTLAATKAFTQPPYLRSELKQSLVNRPTIQ
jgi:hypothetical protein